MDFYKIQMLSSIIPGYSTYFIMFATIFKLSKHRAPFKLWMLFALIVIVSLIVVGLLTNFVLDAFLTEQYKFVGTLIVGAVYVLPNFGMIKLQKIAAQGNDG